MKRVLLAIGVLVLAALSCNAVTGGQNNPASPTNSNSGPAQQNKQVLYQDDFSDSNSGWPTAADADKAASYTADGQYLLQAFTKQQDVWAHPGQDFSDVSIEVDATKSSGPDNNGFGVVCRFQDNNNFYFFMASSDGYQVIGKYDNGNSVYLSADKMQTTSAVHSGTNQVRGDCNGSTLTFYINGQQVSSVTDTSFTSGDVGVIVGTFDDPNVGITFDNFVVYKP